jgi:hypothetical protein
VAPAEWLLQQTISLSFELRRALDLESVSPTSTFQRIALAYVSFFVSFVSSVACWAFGNMHFPFSAA